MQHSRERNGLAYMFQATDPGYGSLDAHAEAGVRDAAVLAEIKIPLEGFFGQIVLVDALQEQVVRGHALRSSDDFAITFGGKHVDAEREVGTLGIGFHVERFYTGGVTMDHPRTIIER